MIYGIDVTWVEGGEEALFTCIYCGRKKAYYNPTKGVGLCFRCDRVYTRKDLAEIGQGRTATLGRLLMRASGKPSMLKGPWVVRAERYLRSRGVDLAEFPTLQVEPEGISFPIYSTVTGAEGRMLKTWSGQWLSQTPRKQEYVFCLSTLPDYYLDQEVVLVEGIFDVLTPRLRYGIALLGSKLSTAQETWIRSLSPSKIWVWMDPDAAGQKAAEEISRRLSDLTTTVVRSEKEPGDMAPEEMPLSWRF